MFPVDRSFVYVAYLQCGLIGLMIGALSGVAVSSIFKLRIHGWSIVIDALLGSIVSVVAVDVLWRLHVRWNFAGALIIAAALAALRELRRLGRHGSGEE
jgi:hypothetical protein